MMAKHFILALVSVALAILIPIYYPYILFFIVGKAGLGWVLTNILLRLAVIIFFALFLHHVLKLFLKERKFRFIYTFLIALLPGFGISFIYPIYNIDYGMIGDDFQLTGKNFLDSHLNESEIKPGEKALYTFFTTTCPHCMEATLRLGTNIESGQKLPVYAFFPSTQSDAEKFLNKFNGDQFHYGLIDNDSAFVTISGGAFPSIFLIDEQGKTLNHWTGDELNYTALDYLKSIEQ